MHARKIQKKHLNSWHQLLLPSDRFAAGAWVILSSRYPLRGGKESGQLLCPLLVSFQGSSGISVYLPREGDSPDTFDVGQSLFSELLPKHAIWGNESQASRTAFISIVLCLLSAPADNRLKPGGLAGASAPEPAPRKKRSIAFLNAFWRGHPPNAVYVRVELKNPYVYVLLVFCRFMAKP